MHTIHKIFLFSGKPNCLQRSQLISGRILSKNLLNEAVSPFLLMVKKYKGNKVFQCIYKTQESHICKVFTDLSWSGKYTKVGHLFKKIEPFI